MSRTKDRTINLLFLIFLFYGISATIISPIIPLLSERLKIGYDKIGLILLVGSIFALLSTFITGRFCDRFNLKKIILTGIILSIIGFLLFTIYLNILIFIFVIIFLRLGQSILDSSVHAYGARIFYRNHSLIFMKLDIFWYIGAIIGPLLMSIVLFIKINIKIIFIILGFFYIIMLIYFYITSPNNELGLVNSNKIQFSGTTLSSGSYNLNNNIRLKLNTFSILKNPIIVIACIVLFFYMNIMACLSSWLTTYFTSLNIPITSGSVILSFFWAFSALGLFLNMKIAEKGKGNDVSLLFACMILGTLSTFIYSFVPIIYVKIIFLMFQAVFYSLIFPLSLSIAVGEDMKKTGEIIGVSMSSGGVASIIFQPFMGYMIEYFGKASIAYILVVTSMLELIMVLALFKLVQNKYRIRFKIY